MRLHPSTLTPRAGATTGPRRGDWSFAGVAVPMLFGLLTLTASAACAADPPSPAPTIELRLPADIVYSRTPGSDSAVVFRHGTHVALAANKCTGCHPQTFHLLKRGPTPTHAEMNGGRSCGSCHDGRQAFGVKDAATCATCHAGVSAAPVAAAGATAGAPAAPKLPKPYRYRAGEGSPGPVTFRHETHMKGGATCAACHPKPFRMAAVPAKPGGGMHEAGACGACHDGKKSFSVEDGEACTRCHKETGAGR